MYRLIILVLLFPLSLHAQPGSAEEVLRKSIQHHDPNGVWGKSPLHLQLRETRPGGADRETSLLIDLQAEHFELNQLRDGNRLLHRLEKGICSYQLDGRTTITEEEIKTHRLNCERTQSMRDYYTYLWGLPMKLQDPGTQLGDKVLDTTFDDQACWGIRITYSPEVGKDIWYFYFDKKTYALIGYRFYHDEAKNDGEYILLEEEMQIGGLKLPKVRKWYTHGEEKFLGADILMRNEE
jgi:hypothetical protein